MKNVNILTVALVLFSFVGFAHGMSDLQKAWETTKATWQPYVNRAKELYQDYTSTTQTNVVQQTQQNCEAFYNSIEAKFNTAVAQKDTTTLSSLDDEIGTFFLKNPNCKTTEPLATKIQSLQNKIRAELQQLKK